MSRNQKIALGIGLGLIVLAGLLWLFARRKEAASPTPNTPTADSPMSGATLPSSPSEAVKPIPNDSAAITPKPAPKPPEPQSAIGRLASMVAERFGSYSNFGDFENILDLQPLMTESMSDWTDGYVKKLRLERSGGLTEYAGVTTRAITVTVTKFDEAAGVSEATVNTQRRSRNANNEEKIEYQDLIIKFEKDGTSWKIDFISWGAITQL